MVTKVRILVLLIGAIALILVILALQLLAPGDQLEQSGPDTAHVAFSADHHMLIAPGACVTVHWQVDHIQAVYIDGQPTVGEGYKQICVDEQTMPLLRVEYVDKTAADFPLTIHFLVEQPATWLLGVAVLLLVFVSVYVALSRPSAPAVAQSGVRRTPRIVLVFAGIGMVFSAILVVGLVLELGLRFYFGRFGTQDEQNAYLRSRAEIEALSSSTIALPFVEYGLSPDYPGHNALGYRGDDIQVPKPDGVYRIVVLGDSSTYGTFSPYDQTYPYDLQKVLRDDYGHKKVEVINGGVLGYTSWNILVDLAFRVTVLQPDLVIVYEGGNDVLPRQVSPECYTAHNSFLGLDPRQLLRAVPPELSPSALYRFMTAQLGGAQAASANAGGLVDHSAACATHAGAVDAQNVAANPPVYFERNVREMIGVAQANGFKIMLATFAYDASNPDALDYWRTAVAEHNAITAKVAQANGVLFLDYAALAPTDRSSWNDSTHLNGAGNLQQAQTIAKYLVDQQVIPAAGS